MVPMRTAMKDRTCMIWIGPLNKSQHGSARVKQAR